MKVSGRISMSRPLPEVLGRWFDLEELVYGRQGLRILLWAKNGLYAWVRFGEPIAYRVCEEGMEPNLSGMLGGAPSGLVTLEGSSWVQEFIDDGPGQRIPGRFTHWCLGAGNFLVEVISDSDPVVEVLPEGAVQRKPAPKA